MTYCKQGDHTTDPPLYEREEEIDVVEACQEHLSAYLTERMNGKKGQ